jgi:hypothetical protein
MNEPSTPCETQYRVAPPGFTDAQWEIFERDGILVLENRLSEAEIERYTDAIMRVAHSDPNYSPDRYYGVENIVERDPVLAELIDHDRHVGFAYDLFGELLKVHKTQIHLRPPGSKTAVWHHDGSRALPYGVFAPTLPLNILIGYWLTDLPTAEMGNMVVLPGSQNSQYLDQFYSSASIPGERPLVFPRGTMTIMQSRVWHRVFPNTSEVTRKNLFIAYCPAWLVSEDRHGSDPEWLKTLNREQRIIMRSYDKAYFNHRPPASEFPLFLDRDTGLDRDPGTTREDVALHIRKRLTAAEKRQIARGEIPDPRHRMASDA